MPVAKFLRNLDLSNNRIKEIPTGLFAKLQILKSLNLATNRLGKSNKTALKNIFTLKFLWVFFGKTDFVSLKLEPGSENFVNLKKLWGFEGAPCSSQDNGSYTPPHLSSHNLSPVTNDRGGGVVGDTQKISMR